MNLTYHLSWNNLYPAPTVEATVGDRTLPQSLHATQSSGVPPTAQPQPTAETTQIGIFGLNFCLNLTYHLSNSLME